MNISASYNSKNTVAMDHQIHTDISIGPDKVFKSFSNILKESQRYEYIPYFRYYKTHLYLFFSVFGATYNRNLEDFYLINKYFRGVFYSRASSIQKRLIIAKIRYSK